MDGPPVGGRQLARHVDRQVLDPGRQEHTAGVAHDPHMAVVRRPDGAQVGERRGLHHSPAPAGEGDHPALGPDRPDPVAPVTVHRLDVDLDPGLGVCGLPELGQDLEEAVLVGVGDPGVVDDRSRRAETGQRRFGDDKRDRLPAECRSCSWLQVCNGGCPKDRIALTEDGEPGLNYLCSGLQQFFAHAEQPLKRVIAGRKRGLNPEAIMTELRAESMARWKGVGRNDPCPCGSGRKAKHCCWPQRP